MPHLDSPASVGHALACPRPWFSQLYGSRRGRDQKPTANRQSPKASSLIRADGGSEIRRVRVIQHGPHEVRRHPRLIVAIHAAELRTGLVERLHRSEEHTSELQSLRHLACPPPPGKKKSRGRTDTHRGHEIASDTGRRRAPSA